MASTASRGKLGSHFAETFKALISLWMMSALGMLCDLVSFYHDHSKQVSYPSAPGDPGSTAEDTPVSFSFPQKRTMMALSQLIFNNDTHCVEEKERTEEARVKTRVPRHYLW